MIVTAVPNTGLVAVSQSGMGTFYMRQDQYALWREKANRLRVNEPPTVQALAEATVLVMLLAAEIMNDRVTA